MTTIDKTRITDTMKARRQAFGGSDAKFAASIGLSPAQFSRLKNGETDRVISDAQWISLSRQLELNLSEERPWKAANTPVFAFITQQLSTCQQESVSALLCDIADIGKTFAAKHYVAHHKYAVYVDCSQVKSKQRLIRSISKQFGIDSTGKYQDVYEDLVYYLRTIRKPLVILDEAGDLQYDAFLELKALWNATERSCGWYMMGADGLKEKIRRAISHKKVGYTEMFSRYGSRYQKIVPDGREEHESFVRTQAAMIAKANAPEGADIQTIVRSTHGSLRRIYTEITKL